MGNLLSHTDMQRAARGVDYMYFSFAVQDGLLEASTVAAIVAAEAGALRMPPCCKISYIRAPKARVPLGFYPKSYTCVLHWF